MIEDSDDPSRAGTPKPMAQAKNSINDGPGTTKEGSGGSAELKNKGEESQDGEDKTTTLSEGQAGGQGKSAEASTSATLQELPSDIKQKLRKLEKLEATYPGRKGHNLSTSKIQVC